MADWVMYLDDSASHGAVLNKKFESIPTANNGFQPVTSAGGICIRKSFQSRIRKDITKLRRKIQARLKLEYLPEIHMRLMWGRDVEKDPANPYRKASPEQRFRWVREAIDILFKYGDRGVLHTCGVSLEIDQTQSVLRQHYEPGGIGLLDHEILKYAFPKAVRPFYIVMLNPLCRMIMMNVIAGNYFCEDKDHTLEVYYDTSDASKGFTASEGMKVLRAAGRFPRIRDIIESSPRDIDFLQLADVAAYLVFRKGLMQYRRSRGLPHAQDVGIQEALRGRQSNEIALRLFGVTRPEARHESEIAMLHIVYASQAIRDLYPDLAPRYLVDPRNYNIAFDDDDSVTGFFQLFTNEVHENWRNGKRPPL